MRDCVKMEKKVRDCVIEHSPGGPYLSQNKDLGHTKLISNSPARPTHKVAKSEK